ncbi:MAG: HK97 family phage prohead protease [Tepidisphaeraceae bacterium]
MAGGSDPWGIGPEKNALRPHTARRPFTFFATLFLQWGCPPSAATARPSGTVIRVAAEIGERMKLLTLQSRRFDAPSMPAVVAQRSPDSSTNGCGVIEGYALLWNVLSEDRGGFRVKLLPGSAKFGSITFALVAHDWARVLGSTRSGSLRLKSDARGVWFSVNLPNATYAHDLLAVAKRRDVLGCSFFMGGQIVGREVSQAGTIVREIKSFTMPELSIVANPAFDAASITSVKAPAAMDAPSFRSIDHKPQLAVARRALARLQLARLKNP